ncbi:MAG: methyltransferase domain-containing protein [Solirubrobacteraceae bacterium]
MARLAVRLLGRRRLRNILLSASDHAVADWQQITAVRDDVARNCLAGDGIEIGALHVPLRMPRSARVRYVDRKGNPGLREDFPELKDRPFVTVDVVDDGETLHSFEDSSLDFVVANHFIEHTQDPIGTLEAQCRVLREHGILFIVAPDRRFTFDRDRTPTTLEHVLRDHAEGPAWSRHDHYREWVRLVERFDPDDVQARARKLDDEGASIHFHNWDFEGFLELVLHCRDALNLPVALEHAQMNGAEFLLVMRKTTLAALAST